MWGTPHLLGTGGGVETVRLQKALLARATPAVWQKGRTPVALLTPEAHGCSGGGGGGMAFPQDTKALPRGWGT